MAAPEIAEGFPGQRIVVLPRSVIAPAEPQPLLGAMIPTDIGYFPKAAGHARERMDGIDSSRADLLRDWQRLVPHAQQRAVPLIQLQAHHRGHPIEHTGGSMESPLF